MVWIGLVWLRIETSGGGSCEDDIEPSGSMKCWEALECLHNWRPQEGLSSVSK
jgi:hypothetical protein